MAILEVIINCLSTSETLIKSGIMVENGWDAYIMP